MTQRSRKVGTRHRKLPLQLDSAALIDFAWSMSHEEFICTCESQESRREKVLLSANDTHFRGIWHKPPYWQHGHISWWVQECWQIVFISREIDFPVASSLLHYGDAAWKLLGPGTLQTVALGSKQGPNLDVRLIGQGAIGENFYSTLFYLLN